MIGSDDHRLLVKVMLTDLLAQYEDTRDEMTELDRQVRERFGDAAMEHSADYFTGWHYSPEDILNTAIFEPAWLADLMRHGSRDCCSSVANHPHRDWCAEPDDEHPLVACRRRADGSLMTWAEYERAMGE